MGRGTIALYTGCGLAAAVVLRCAPRDLGPALLQAQCVVVALVAATVSRTRVAHACAGILVSVAFVLAAGVHVMVGRVLASRWTCGYDPDPTTTLLSRIFGVVGFAFMAAQAALAFREALSRSARTTTLATLSLLLAASGATIRTAARVATSPNWDAYVDAMPIVAELPPVDPVLDSDDPIEVAGITIRRGWGLEMMVDGALWKATLSRECHIVGSARIRIRHDATERVWVVEDERGTRCPFDEITHSDHALTWKRVAGSVSAPVGWTVSSLITLACAVLLLLRARVKVGPHVELGPYRTPPAEEEHSARRAPPTLVLAFSLALVAISPLVWIQ